MYPRWLYVGLLGLAVGALQFTASFGQSWQVTVAYGTAVALGGVVFFHGEKRVTPGPIFSNFTLAVVAGSVLQLLIVAGLLAWILGIPPDLALWNGGLLTWKHAIGIGFTLASAFFVIGVFASFR